MTIERFEEIFADVDSELQNYRNQCTATLGLNLISKYSNKGIVGAEHDIIYSVSIEEIIANGITEEDVTELRKMNWIIEYDSLACFV